ncbi:MAG: PAS domain S-box protein [bacterium]|nr:PAS domain S-box protein [bacterium]
MVGTPVYDYVPATFRPNMQACFERVFNSGQPGSYDTEYHDRDDNIHVFESHVGPVMREDQVTSLMVRSTDITDRRRVEEELERYHTDLYDSVQERTAALTEKNVSLRREIAERERAEQALRASEQHYRALAEYVADGIIILQEEKIVFVNDALCTMIGHAASRLLNAVPEHVFRDDYKQPFKTWMAELRRGRAAAPLQAICLTKDGREIWTETRSRRIAWEGKPAILIAMRDITERMLQDLAREEERERLAKENITLRATLKDRYKFGEPIGKSQAMQEIYEMIAHAAATDANVLISGESGTGKGLLARTIHQLSDRKDQNFVPVNCGAVPETLFESEFFGYRKGAFSGANRDKAGYLDRAHQGTLFLDEVGELNPFLQVKLLRVLDLQEYMPLGGNIHKTADLRIIAATNRDVTEQLRQGAMREDFFYRINVVNISIPPLRERKKDLPLLIDHLLEQYSPGEERAILPLNVLQ